MPARFILHVVITIVLLTIGWWLYMRLDDSGYKIDSIMVATYWFTILVFIFFSWLFYWFVHKLKTKYWVAAQLFAITISAISIISLLYISKEHQKLLEEEAIKEEQVSKAESLPEQNSASSNQIETLNASEDEIDSVEE